MPRPLHNGWGGYDRLESKDDAGNKLTKARCRICGKTMSKTTEKFMLQHTKTCKAQKNDSDKDTSSDLHRSDSSNSDQTDTHPDLHEDSSTSSHSSFQSHASYTMERSDQDSSINQASSLKTTSTPRTAAERTYEEDSISEASSPSPPTSRSISSVRTAKRNINQSRKKRKFSEDSNEASDDDKAIAIYKYFLVSNIDFQNIHLPASIDFIKTFDPDFKVPTAQELCGIVAQKAADRVFQKNHDKDYSQILQLIVQVIEGQDEDGDCNKVMALSLLQSSKGDWTYLKSIKFFSKPEAEILGQIESFCDMSVKEAKQEYGIDILFVLHNGKYDLQTVSEVVCGNVVIKYYTVCEVPALLKQLQCDLVCNASNHEQVSNFYKNVQRIIPRDIECDKLSMSTSIERVFQAISELDERNQAIVSDKLLYIVNPLHLSAKVFHPQYHMRFLDQNVHKSVDSLFRNFQMFKAPPSLVNPFPYYLEKSAGCFRMLYTEMREADPLHFWLTVRVDRQLSNAKLLANYAMQLLNLPAALKVVNLQDMFDKYDKHRVGMSDFDKVLFTYLME